jgi:hypothetical protein
VKIVKLRELIDMLEDFDQEAEVRLACQPSWPLAFNVAGAVADSELADFVDERDTDDVPEPARNVVWIVQGDHPHEEDPYAPKACWPAVQALTPDFEW